MQVNPLGRLTVKEIVALGVAGIKTRVVRRREGAVSCLAAVEYKGAGEVGQLSPGRYSKVCETHRMSDIGLNAVMHR